MIGFVNTECKIKNCKNPIWPNKTLGFCNKHYQRYKTGRMTSDGSLKPKTIIKTCNICKKEFIVKGANHVKYCKKCRLEQYKIICKNNYRGIYRRGKLKTITPQNIWEKAQNHYDKKVERKKNYLKINEQVMQMRNGKMSYQKIGLIMGCSGQNIQQKIKRYLKILQEV